jgi:hypothetical protein
MNNLKELILICALPLHLCCAQTLLGKKIIVQEKASFTIESENEAIDRSFIQEPMDTVRAGLRLEGDDINEIRFTKAYFSGDTVNIVIYETSEASNHKYVISILNERYTIKYNFLASGELDDEGKIIPFETKLILNSSKFVKGHEIRGYTQFKGKCAQPCNEELIIVSGNFKAIIK